jgi:hypothetical protein
MLLSHQHTVLRSPIQAKVDEIGTAEIVVGVPCYNNESSIAHVMRTVSDGLAQHYPNYPAVLVVADGGSTDDTRERSRLSSLPSHQHQIITVYRGVSGKGSAFRTIFAVAAALEAQACICVDADLRSITPDWIRYLLTPLLAHGYEFVAPLYARYKYDGTITNNVVYCLTRALYGQRIRQPIGGDFAFSGRLARHYLAQPVWTTDVARFGIDIWMTLEAIVSGSAICQTNLGVKLHDAKDPAIALGPMFQQVCGTLFTQIEKDISFWRDIRGSVPAPTFRPDHMLDPAPIAVNKHRLVQEFQAGFQAYRPLYQLLYSAPVFQTLQTASESPVEIFSIPCQIWTRLLYEFIAAYHRCDRQRSDLIRALTPLYLGQVASFMTQTQELDFQGAEAIIDDLATCFEHENPYFLACWHQQSDWRN